MGSSSKGSSSKSSSSKSSSSKSFSSKGSSSNSSSSKSSSSKESYCSKEYADSVCRCEGKNWYKVLKRKLENLNVDELLEELKIENQHDLIHHFGNEDLFLEKFLKIKAKNHEELLKNMVLELNQLRDFQIHDQEMTEDSFRNMWKNMLEYREQSKKYNLYLFIEKIDRIDNNFVYKKIGNLVCHYGAFHVGLEIDGIIVEWGYGRAGSSIVCPRIDPRKMLAYVRLNYEKLDSKWSDLFKVLLPILIGTAAVATGAVGVALIQLGNISVGITSLLVVVGLCSYAAIYHLGEITKDRLRLIAEKCVYYNKNHYYSLHSRHCQHFVDEMLACLNIKFTPEGEFRKFMERIRYHGDASFQFKNTTFESRKEFDSYVDIHWKNLKNEWDKKLLICYSDVMESLYLRGEDVWGPKNIEVWLQRYEDLK
ncbi:hypothetical protein F8M41_000782 [Gigaspora margarita]|uniref:Uncharacterized protein n=1 Tax=Gigaspora margarita TaxID=4874 RepID=A0A8H3XIH6_GIGMA|nr:hypothetical protein F8M41_000782 [Gigaspora margarita]